MLIPAWDCPDHYWIGSALSSVSLACPFSQRLFAVIPCSKTFPCPVAVLRGSHDLPSASSVHQLAVVLIQTPFARAVYSICRRAVTRVLSAGRRPAADGEAAGPAAGARAARRGGRCCPGNCDYCSLSGHDLIGRRRLVSLLTPPPLQIRPRSRPCVTACVCVFVCVSHWHIDVV